MKYILFFANVLLIVFIAFINYKNEKKIVKINFLYTLIWFITLTVSIINPLDLYEPNLKLSVFITISLLFFNVVYYIIIPKMEKKEQINIKGRELFNYKIIYVLNILAIIAVIPNFIASLKIIIGNGFDLSMVRNSIYIEIGNSGNDFLILLTRTFPAAVFSITTMFGAINLSKGSKKLLFISIFDLFLYSLTFGGRMIIFAFIIYYFSSLMLQGASIKFKNIKKMKYIIIILLLITVFRFSSAVKILEQIELYFFSSLSYLSKMLSSPADFGLNNRMFGYITFSAIIEPFILVGKLLFGWKVKVPTYYLNTYTQPFIDIGNSATVFLNNNCSFFYSFILDWGYLGIIIGPIILLLIMAILEKNALKNSSNLSYVFLIYLYSVFLLSNMFFKLNGITSSLILIFIIICTKKNNTKDMVIKNEQKKYFR